MGSEHKVRLEERDSWASAAGRSAMVFANAASNLCARCQLRGYRALYVWINAHPGLLTVDIDTR